MELYTGRPLFPGKNHNDQLWHVMKGIGHLTDHQMRLLRKDPQLTSFRQPMPHEHVSLEKRCVGNEEMIWAEASGIQIVFTASSRG